MSGLNRKGPLYQTIFIKNFFKKEKNCLQLPTLVLGGEWLHFTLADMHYHHINLTSVSKQDQTISRIVQKHNLCVYNVGSNF